MIFFHLEALTIDVCKTCHANATCIEKNQKYSCMCNFGLIGNGRTQCLGKSFVFLYLMVHYTMSKQLSFLLKQVIINWKEVVQQVI